MTTEFFWGETITIVGHAQTGAGEPILMDAGWAAACRITKTRIGGEVIVDPAMEIVDGQAVADVDTGEPIWTHGVYYYDIRLTDPSGKDHWSGPHRLILRNRNARAS